MPEFIINIDDSHTEISPLCHHILTPHVNPVHPAKHIAPMNRNNLNRYPFSLFIDRKQRDRVIELIQNNNLLRSVIYEKLQTYGGDFRIFADIHISILEDEYLNKFYWSFCPNNEKTHHRKELEWIGIGLDFIATEQTQESITASMQTIFPIESELKTFPSFEHTVINGISVAEAEKKYTSTKIFIEVLCKKFTEKLAISEKGQQNPVYQLSESNIHVHSRWIDDMEKHNIFAGYKSNDNEKKLRAQIIHAIKPLPFYVEKLPDIEGSKVIFQRNVGHFSDEIMTARENKNAIRIIKQLDLEQFYEEIEALIDATNDHLNSLKAYDSANTANAVNFLATNKDRFKKLKAQLFNAAIITLSKSHLPQFDINMLINIYQMFKERADEAKQGKQKKITLSYDSLQFSISEKSGSAAQKKFKETFKPLTDSFEKDDDGYKLKPRINIDSVISRMIPGLSRILVVNNQKLIECDELRGLREVIDIYDTGLKSIHANLMNLEKAYQEYEKVNGLIEQNKSIKSRDFALVQEELNDILETVKKNNCVDLHLIRRIQNHLIESKQFYAVTEIIDKQVTVFSHSIKNKFSVALCKLIKAIINDKSMSIEELKAIDWLFFINNDSDKIRLNPDLFRLPELDHQQFCEYIDETVKLIKSLQAFLNHLENPDEKYPKLIDNLINIINQFEQFRQSHPYVFNSLSDENPILQTPYFLVETCVYGLNDRLKCEQSYSRSLNNQINDDTHSNNISILSDFLHSSNKLYITLNTIEKLMHRLEQSFEYQGNIAELEHTGNNTSATVLKTDKAKFVSDPRALRLLENNGQNYHSNSSINKSDKGKKSIENDHFENNEIPVLSNGPSRI